PEQLIVTEIVVPPVSIWPSVVVVPPELAHAMHGRSGRKARPKSALPPPRLSIPPSSNPPIPAPFNRPISPNRHRSTDTEKAEALQTTDMTSKVMPHNSTTLEEMDPKQENNKLVKDVDEKLLYETFSVFGVIVTNPKDGFKNGSDMPIVM
ncbi:hypothetical protein ACJX0J_021865, partial [Zea mays]